MQKIDISELSILLIEPSSTQLKVIMKHLKAEGINHIEGAESGAQALSFLEDYQPDLIISSMYLPDMMATELVERIKSLEKTQEIPFMLISSETRVKVLEVIRQAGVVAILPKPFDHEDLKRALLTTIEYVDPQILELEYTNISAIRVLLVDDSRFTRKHIHRVLQDLGIDNIVEARDGKEAIQVFLDEEEAFDLIVTDYNMPEMDGREMIEYVRNNLHNSYIPILMVTSEQDQARLSSIKKAGVSAILDKPFDPMTVKEILYRVLE